MTRVAYVSADRGVPIFGAKGCSLHAQEVLGAMLRRGAEVHLFSTSADGQPASGLEGVVAHPLPRPNGEPAERERAALAGNQTVREQLAAGPPFDFVYERYSLWNFAAMEFARERGVPGLLEINAPLIEEQARYRVLVDRAAAEKVADRVFSAARVLLPVSDEVAAWVERFPNARGKVRVVPNGIRRDRFPESVTPALPASAGVFTVGFVGTLKAWHGLSELVDAFAQLCARHPDTRLLVVGDGPERANLEASLASRGLGEASVLTGAVPPAEVPGLLASMDVAVAPYPALDDFYFSPLKVYEYMAAGLPVVASGIGQLRKLIQSGQNGLLVTPGAVAELVNALERLKADPGLRAALGRAARQMVLSNHTWDSVVDTIFTLARAGSVAAPPVLAGG